MYLSWTVIVFISIKRQISGQSTCGKRLCMYIMFDMVDAAFNYRRALIVWKFLQKLFKVKESSLHEIWNADTPFVLYGTAYTEQLFFSQNNWIIYHCYDSLKLYFHLLMPKLKPALIDTASGTLLQNCMKLS